MFTDDAVNLLSLIFQGERDRIKIEEVFAHPYCVEIIRQEQEKVQEVTARKYHSNRHASYRGTFNVESEEQDDIELSPKSLDDALYGKKDAYPEYSRKYAMEEVDLNIRTAVC